MLDEADKTPTEVILVLKRVMKDNQLSPPDGCILGFKDKLDSLTSYQFTRFLEFRPWLILAVTHSMATRLELYLMCSVVIMSLYWMLIRTINSLALIWEELRIAHTIG